jgi:C-terminal processing protease CtpA/Prc
MRRIASAVAIAVALGAALSAQGMSATDAYRVKAMLQSAYEAVKRNYYDTKFHGLDWDARYREYQKKIEGAPSLNAGVTLIAAFLEGLKDSHTFFSPPARPYQVDYGYRIAMVGPDAYVTRVRPDTDAETKVKPGDRVVGVNGNAISRDSLASMDYYFNVLSPQQNVRLTVRDPAGQQRDVTVAAKVKQGRQVRDLTGADGGMDFADLVRDQEANDQLLRHRYHEDENVLIWKMPIFNLENAEVDRIFGLARKKAALIIDMRGNPGGYVDTARRMVSNAFDRDIQMAERVSRKGKEQVSARTRGSSAFTGKLIVLVDSQSGSAAEVFARVLQLEERGRVLGDRSAGAVMESRQYPFAVESGTVVIFGVSVTSADLIMKDGKSIEHLGVTPDEVVLPTAADLASGRDPVLARAAQLVCLNLDPVAAGRLFPFEWRKFQPSSSAR